MAWGANLKWIQNFFITKYNKTVLLVLKIEKWMENLLDDKFFSKVILKA